MVLIFPFISVCSPNGFYCASHRSCIPISFRCDGSNNCGDGSDEKNCSGKDILNFFFFSNVYLMFKRYRIYKIINCENATIYFNLLQFENDVLLPVEHNVVLHFLNNIVNNEVLS